MRISPKDAIQSENLSSGSFSFLSPPSSQPWAVDRTYPSHHNGIVRSFLVDDVLGCLVTGGEDGVLHLWDLRSLNAPTSPSKPRRKRKLDAPRELDEMEVDPVQASAVKVRRFPPFADIPTSHPKSRNGGDPRPRLAPRISPPALASRCR